MRIFCDSEYDVEADWIMLKACNFGCDYCFFSRRKRREKLAIFASNKQWREAFDKTALRWSIHLTGGEPSIYPKFLDLCLELTQSHLISINSNLSTIAFHKLAKKINPDRVRFINASLHPNERYRLKGFGMFADNYKVLRDKGFNVFASMVATPESLMRFDEISDILMSDEIYVIPKLLRGEYRGKSYPNDYTDQEKKIFRFALKKARKHYEQVWGKLREPPTINPLQDDRYLDGLPDFVGKKCASGKNFVRINEAGVVYDCSNMILGNLLSSSLSLRRNEMVCKYRFCHYWCTKYVGNSAYNTERELFVNKGV